MSINQSLYYAMPVPAQNALVTAYGYYLKQKRHGSGAAELRALIAQSQLWTRQEVIQHQTIQLRSILELCATRVPYYRQAFASLGGNAAQVQGPEDLQRLPLLPKQTVRTEGARFVVDGARPFWTQHTSGSTGTPVVVHLNQRTYQLVHALLEQHEANCGVGPTDLRATFAGRMVQPAEHLTPPFWRYNRAQRQLLFSAYHMSPPTLRYYVEELVRRQPAELIGYPSAITAVATHINASGRSGEIRPRVIITNSETLYGWQRETMEQAFGCPVRDYYGSAEAVVFAAQCDAGTYHFNPLIVIAEVVDERGAPAKPGEVGRLVCTTLTNMVMPLVRYEIGDAAIRLDGPCRCGSVLDGVSQIVGRQDDTITTPDGRAIGRIDHIFKGAVGIRECQVIQETLDLIRLLIVADDNFSPGQAQLLVQNLRGRIGDGVRIELVRVAEIPRTRAGKFRGVLSRVTTEPGRSDTHASLASEEQR
jgi:phenylacetate-CoA ligase